MKKIEKKIYNEIVLQAYNQFPEEGKIDVGDTEKEGNIDVDNTEKEGKIDVGDPGNRLFKEWIGDNSNIYMYTAYTPEGLRVGVIGIRPMLKSVPNCTFAFNDVQSFFNFVKRNNISAKFPFIKKEEVANETV
jgi:hypothetical protein